MSSAKTLLSSSSLSCSAAVSIMEPEDRPLDSELGHAELRSIGE